MVLTIFAPEFILGFAAGQKLNARRTTDSLHAMRHTTWTPRHSFYANMGGFVLQPRDSPPFPIHGIHLVWLIREGYLTLPEITKEEIADKSKANLLNKGIVCIQTGWFVVQCLGRWHQKVPLTTLELATISYVWCTWGIYAYWLDKPLDVGSPTILKIDASTADILTRAGIAASNPDRYTPLDFVWDWHNSWTTDVQPHLHFRIDPRERPLPRILNDGFPWLDRATDASIVSLMAMFYGAIHMFGWNFIFPTAIEKTLWRVSALVVLCTVTAFVLWELGWAIIPAWHRLYINKQPIRPRSIYYVWANKLEKISGANGLPIHNVQTDRKFMTIAHLLFWIALGVLYVLSRLYIMGEALASLRALPSETFQDVDWTKYIPHS